MALFVIDVMGERKLQNDFETKVGSSQKCK